MIFDETITFWDKRLWDNMLLVTVEDSDTFINDMLGDGQVDIHELRSYLRPSVNVFAYVCVCVCVCVCVRPSVCLLKSSVALRTYVSMHTNARNARQTAPR